jgi:stearoyl-CoA desaturase (delta-9 desaturase)
MFEIIVMFFWWQIIAGVGISAGLHRYFAHKQYDVPIWMEYIFLWLSTLAGARSPIGWIGAHRMHHNHSDTDKDPHSPKYKGFWNVLLNQWELNAIDRKYVRECWDKPSLVFFHKHWGKIWIVSSIIFYMLGIFYLIVGSAILGFVGFGWVNAICHSVNGGSKNVMWVNILVGGEGYHDEHHKNGKKIRMGNWDHTGFLIEKLLFLTGAKSSVRTIT